MPNLDLGVIGNCQVAALIDARARMLWACVPRLDGDPVFCALLDGEQPEHGYFDIELDGFARSEQRYVENTAILETTLHDDRGGVLRIVDFSPRFGAFGRSFHPIMFVRMIERLAGSPRLRIRLRPRHDWGASSPQRTFGSNHIRYLCGEYTMRLTSNAPVSAVLEENAFVLEDRLTLILGPDETINDSVTKVGQHFYDETHAYWRRWVRGLSVPFEWQDAVIRSAITLKLCTFEDTGAVVAALTTSIPEAPGTQRNWDYRYCWLRDSYFVIQALNRLGATKTMQGYLRYIINVAAEWTDAGDLQPVYGISGRGQLTERIVDSLAGYRGMGPVRVGNQAYEQIQHDVYGAVVLALTHAFVDRRLAGLADLGHYARIERAGARAIEVYDKPDAGLWEYRGRAQVHTFSSAMCWAACDRLAKLAAHMGENERARRWRAEADRMHTAVMERGWNDKRQAFTESFTNEHMDASLLLLNELGFVEADDPRFRKTVEAIENDLRRGNYLYRYAAPDDFGAPETAFNICTFWYIEALAAIGRKDEARELFENMLACRNPLGLLSEDLMVDTGELWGNFPQTYSLCGIINAAMRLSKSWEDAF